MRWWSRSHAAAAASLAGCVSVAVAANSAAHRTDACALPPGRLFLSADGGASTTCDDNGALSSACAAACSCRRLVHNSILDQVFALCLNGSSEFSCSAVDCRTFTTTMMLSVDNNDDANESPQEFAVEGGRSGPAIWVWVVVGVGAVLLLALAVFLINWFRHRPRKGDNRTEVAEAERAVQWRKDTAAAARRESVTTTRTARTHDTNASVISGESGESYHGYVPSVAQASPAQQRYGSPLTGTELAVNLYPTERVFSPISDESKDSSEYSQGVDDDGSVIRTPLVQRGLVDVSESSDIDSLSSGLTIEEESTRSDAPYPQKKSIEF